MTRPVIPFTSVRGEYGWLGNMSPWPLTITSAASWRLSGTWRTSEALFQAMRFDDREVHEEIRACRSPMHAKMVAKRNRHMMVIEPRGKVDLANMEQVLQVKLDQHPELKRRLVATGEALIVEDVTARGVNESNVFWGAALINGEWVGENWLGRTWMDLRRRLG